MISNELNQLNEIDLEALFDEDDDKATTNNFQDTNSYSPIESTSTVSLPPVSSNQKIPVLPNLPNRPYTNPSTKDNDTNKQNTLDHLTQCPSCKIKYTEKGNTRRMMDTCGHGICFKCVVTGNNCFICTNSNETASSMPNTGEYESPQKQNNSDRNQNQHLRQLGDSPLLLNNPPKSNTSNNNDMRPLSIRKNSDLFAMPKAVVSKNKSTCDDVFVIDSIGTKSKSTK